MDRLSNHKGQLVSVLTRRRNAHCSLPVVVEMTELECELKEKLMRTHTVFAPNLTLFKSKWAFLNSLHAFETSFKTE